MHPLWLRTMTGLTLLPDLIVEPFNRADVRVLFPLMRLAEPDIDLPRWMAFATKLTRRRDGKAGILVARRSVRRFPCGAGSYRLLDDLRHGSVLLVEHFVAADPIDPQSVLRALSGQLDVVARDLGCPAIRVLSPDGSTTVELRRAGHEGAGMVMSKILPPPQKEHTAFEAVQLPR